MSKQATYYLQQRRVGKTEWGPPFEKTESIEEAFENLRNYRKSVFAREMEYRLVKMTEVKE